jgi:hypothetical protein
MTASFEMDIAGDDVDVFSPVSGGCSSGLIIRALSCLDGARLAR